MNRTHNESLPSNNQPTIGSIAVVLGASGFVGSAIADELRSHGWQVQTFRTPRLSPVEGRNIPRSPDPSNLSYLEALQTQNRAALASTRDLLSSATVVINAAGMATATSADGTAMILANSYLPTLLLGMLRENQRLIHISSAAVQGRIAKLDALPRYAPFSPYSRSKALGEHLLLGHNAPNLVIFRPPAVHGNGRSVTRNLANLARSPFSSVSAPGDMPTAQTLIENVSAAIRFLADYAGTPPTIVTHPSEAINVSELLELLGGKPPRRLPAPLARFLVSIVSGLGVVVTPAAGVARRLETLWFGQDQDPSWLDTIGWRAPHGRQAWRTLARALIDTTYLEMT